MLESGSPASWPTAAGTSPKATRLARARWTDARLLFGVLLVVTSMVAGSRLLANADRSSPVWSASRDLATGIRLTAADVAVRDVRLGSDQSNYLLVRADDPVGMVLTRPVSAGDLLPVGALEPGSAATDQRREVTVPITAFHYPPDLARGRLVDVYLTSGADASSGGSGPPAVASASDVPELLVPGALVVEVTDGGTGFSGPASTVGVVLSVSADQVPDLVAGIRAGSVDLVQVPDP